MAASEFCKGPYIYDNHEKCPVFAPPRPPPPFPLFPSVRMGSNWARLPAPGRQNLGDQTPVWNTVWTLVDIQFLWIPSPTPVTIHFHLNFHNFLPDHPSPHLLDHINV